MLNYNPFEQVRQSMNRGGGGGFERMNYLKIADGETVVLRFLNGLDKYTVYNHDCGLTLYDIPTSYVEDAKAAGQPVICPNCGKPLADSDIAYERPMVLVVDTHPYTTAPNGQKRNFLCLDSKLNHDQGLIGDEHYSECPVREKDKETGEIRHARPRVRAVAAAVIRDVDYIQENRGGRPVQVYQGSHDQLDENGNPQVVVVDQSMYSFWQYIFNALGNDDYTQSICDFDWSIRRLGSGIDTKYEINILNLANPFPVDMRDYNVPDFRKKLENEGSVAHFTGNGFTFAQSTPQTATVETPAPTPAPPAAIQNNTYGRPVGGTVPWDNVRPN